MFLDNQEAFVKSRCAPSGLVICIKCPTLRVLLAHQGAVARKWLIETVESRVMSVLNQANGFWSQETLFVQVSDPMLADEGEAMRLAKRLYEVLAKRFVFEHSSSTSENVVVPLEQEIFVTPHMGLYYLQDEPFLDALRKAEEAVDQTMGDNGIRLRTYQPVKALNSFASILSRQTFLKAVEERAFEVVFQPQVEMQSGMIRGFETLLRAPQDTQYTALSASTPQDILALAGELNMVTELSIVVLEKAMEARQRWAKLWPNLPLTVSVNMSPRTLVFGWEAIKEAVPFNRQTPWLIFELTEGQESWYGTDDDLRRVVNEIRAHGIEVSVDDFGKGLSNIDRVRELACDEIKIDRMLIDGMMKRKEDLRLIESMIHIATATGVRVVAEGIETQYQWSRLVDLGCSVGQGFYIAPGQPEAIVSHYLKQLNEHLHVPMFPLSG